MWPGAIYTKQISSKNLAGYCLWFWAFYNHILSLFSSISALYHLLHTCSVFWLNSITHLCAFSSPVVHWQVIKGMCPGLAELAVDAISSSKSQIRSIGFSLIEVTGSRSASGICAVVESLICTSHLCFYCVCFQFGSMLTWQQWFFQVLWYFLLHQTCLLSKVLKLTSLHSVST